MGQRISDGSVVIDMIRPLNYRTTQLAMATGMSVLEGVFSFGFAIGIGLFFFDMAGPASPLHLVLFAVSVALGFVTKTMIVFLFSLAIFWTLQGVGIAWARDAVIQVLAGTLIPLALMPGWLRIPAEVLPLRGIISTPVTIYLGKTDGLGLVGLIALQVAWLAVLWWGADRLWNRAFRAAEIQGG
jgi:ABC-2 type transport system permease protein